MKKSILSLTAIAAALVTFSGVASADSQQHCYALEYGKDGLGSTHSAFAPYVRSTSDHKTFITVTNSGWEKVNLRITLRNYSGEVFEPTTWTNTINYPQSTNLFDQDEWTILKPFETAEVLIGDNLGSDSYSAEIIWQADQCLENALVGSVRTEYQNGGQYDQAVTRLNSGRVF